MRFVTLFLKTENVHLIKDVGMIPYRLYKDHGFDCTLACYKNSEEYAYTDNEVKGLKLDFVRKTKAGIIPDGMRYLAVNARKIDILNIYHLNLSSYFYEIVYRLFNRKGKIYLKLDMNPAGFVSCFKKNPVGIIKRATIKRADIVSVETTQMLKKLKKYYGEKVIFIPNGCYTGPESEGLIQKENIILTVGNLGTYEKATDVLLEAYAQYIGESPDSDWKLRLVGSIDEGFKPYIDDYFRRYPGIADRVTFTGPINDREKLSLEYERARVFTLPSLSESFGIVLVEAACRGCYLITSDMVPAGYDISDRYRYGLSVPAGSPLDLADAFTRVCSGLMDWDDIAKKTAARVRTAYDWHKIVNRLHDRLC